VHMLVLCKWWGTFATQRGRCATHSFCLYFANACMFPSTISVDCCLADRARLELEEYNKLLVQKTFDSGLSAFWVPLAHHDGMKDLIRACGGFQDVRDAYTLVEDKVERAGTLTPPKMYESTARGMIVKWERTLLCTGNYSSAVPLPEMESDGGWLILGSLGDANRTDPDLGQVFFWGAGDHLHTAGISSTIYATFRVSLSFRDQWT